MIENDAVDYVIVGVISMILRVGKHDTIRKQRMRKKSMIKPKRQAIDGDHEVRTFRGLINNWSVIRAEFFQ